MMEVTYFTFHVALLAILSTTSCMPLCPDGCDCSESEVVPSVILVVNCHGNLNVSSGQLTEQLDLLLSSNITYGFLESLFTLRIIGSPLTNVPRSVCRLTTLTELYLAYNRLTRLPDNCFSNFSALTTLDASFNSITELQDGVFDGLHTLSALLLNSNNISSIGLQVFHCPQKLTRLIRVDLKYNRIQTLEPWPIYLGLNGHAYPNSKTLIDLRGNNISIFSNKMGCKPHCGMKAVHIDLKLGHNPIKHLTDIARGWNITSTTFLCLLPTLHQKGSSHFSFYHGKFECDCVDFYIYKIVRSLLGHFDTLNGAYCGSPATLEGREITSVPLDKFVCELTERCPHECRCVHRPFNATLHLYCSNTNLIALPLKLPALPKSYTKYKLDLSNNPRLSRLEYSDYFVNTSILDLSNCNLDSIDFKMWNELAKIPRVLLAGNRLQSLPSSIATVNLDRTHISLDRNPWKCSCDANWMPDWLKSINSSLINPISITCSSPGRLQNGNIMSIDKKAFCVDPTSEAVKRALQISIPLTAGTFIVLLSIGFIIYRLRVMLYTKWKFHPFDRDECLVEDMDFDVFLSCCSDDNLPYGNEIRMQLEQRGYRVCYPPRDFIAGEASYDNIYNAVVCSKRTVCFLTQNFLQSGYCMQEFDIAFHHNIMVKRKKRLVVLMALDSPAELFYDNDASDTAALRQYLRQYTYIDYTTDDWMDRLLYALPLHGMLQDGQRAGENRQDDDELVIGLQAIPM